MQSTGRLEDYSLHALGASSTYFRATLELGLDPMFCSQHVCSRHPVRARHPDVGPLEARVGVGVLVRLQPTFHEVRVNASPPNVDAERLATHTTETDRLPAVAALPTFRAPICAGGVVRGIRRR